MNQVLTQTFFMFLLSFAISMIVAFLIFLIKRMLTSLAFNSLFDENVKLELKRARKIKKARKKELKKRILQFEDQHKIDLFDFYKGIDSNIENQKKNNR